MALTKVKAGNILLTTPSASSNDVTPATTQYVTTALANLADSAPSTLNTLNELAAALGDDANFSTTVTNSIAAKLPLAGGTLTGALIGTSFSDGYISWGAAQLNRYGSNIELQYTPTANSTVYIGANGSNPTRFNAHTGAASFSGSVGIGTENPAYKLHLSGTGLQRFEIDSTDNNANGCGVYLKVLNSGSIVSQSTITNDNAGNLKFFTGTSSESEKMRITSAGDMWVGKTEDGTSNAGHVFFGAGAAYHIRSGGFTNFFNRTSSDGEILRFAKDGTAVGSIGANGGYIYVGSGDTNLRFHAGSDAILPANAGGATRSAAIDLGTSGAKFKDLHLSGTMLGNITKLRTHTSSMYVSPTNTNTLNGNYDADSDTGDMWINYRGYQDGFARFRDFRVGNGKGGQIVLVDGSAGSVSITGSLSVTSSFSKGSGSFKIDHPLEAKKDTHHLVHSFVEAPQADNIYRGTATLSSGTATINLDTVSGMTEGTYVLLNTNSSCFTSNETDWDAVKGSVSGNILTINCQNSSSTATVSWLVIGERHDQHMKDTDWTDADGKVIVEPLKEIE